MPPPDLLAYGREVLGRQAFSVLMGARLDAFEAGSVELSLAVVPALLQQDGFVHGGVLAYLADNALTYAGGSVLGKVLTSEFKINYLRPATGAFIVARAVVVHAGRNQAVCRCDVTVVTDAGDESLCATAQGTIARSPADASA